MALEQYIKELLFDYECVTIPGFGAFLTRSYDFQVNNITGEFSPSRKELTFNSLLTSNDGVLANYFAKKQNVSYESAIRLIEKEAGVWKNKLNTQPIYIGSLGKMMLNQNKKIEFEPYGKLNFDSSVYGLSSFIRKPVNSLKSSKIIFLRDKIEKLEFIPENKKAPIRKPFYRYAAIGLITIALSTSSFYFGEQYVNDQRHINQEVAQNEIQNNVQSATFNLGKLNSVSLTVGVTKKKEKTKLKNPYYSIIAGSFRNKIYAKRKIKTLKKEGYNAVLAEVNPKGMFRVAYGRFKSKDDAIKLLYLLKYTLKKDAWYLIER
ncbi:MAG: hypothetical protein ACI914_000237 [Candidatus Marivariicella framensis]|jgi:hypothetical protein|tara:strand:- start:4727 stop:5686 length:960 start_codon:yes stop_codon:yes gene_type:complete